MKRITTSMAALRANVLSGHPSKRQYSSMPPLSPMQSPSPCMTPIAGASPLVSVGALASPVAVRRSENTLSDTHQLDPTSQQCVNAHLPGPIHMAADAAGRLFRRTRTLSTHEPADKKRYRSSMVPESLFYIVRSNGVKFDGMAFMSEKEARVGMVDAAAREYEKTCGRVPSEEEAKTFADELGLRLREEPVQ
eukprot:TRINITY_DN3372_c0_g1_i1.p1 TRINITY_DN3372_c0_g1~~TRINITY_DN3372_c0_g1_i1.p1  ORF type:complete len:220 (-),score=20.31 TRINITY_DN3372_c0_g1_i1:347-925(-)